MLSPARSAAVETPPKVKEARMEARRAYKRDIDLSAIPQPDFDRHVPNPFSGNPSDDLMKKLKF